MIFKEKWEKTNVIHQLPAGMAEKMIKKAYPDRELKHYKIVSDGCANLNIQFQLDEDPYNLILRIYLRDKHASFKEQKLNDLIKDKIPIPKIYHIDEIGDYHFAITNSIDGVTLRNFLIKNKSYEIMHEVGVYLAKISSITFLKKGFFDKDLNIIEETEQDDYLTSAKECLNNQNILDNLSMQTIKNINSFLNDYSTLLPDKDQKYLVHCDFDPSNILVNEIDGYWKITGILDWEFSHSGSYLCDISNMLRYTHKLPKDFEHNFLQGLLDSDIKLPQDWKISTDLLNLTNLLDLLSRTDLKTCPNRVKDIKELINFIHDKFFSLQ